ncbi:MAG: hypothetical protein GY711_00080 [bacterium]|nr:hypothetical protein [bacterium]
MATEPAPPLLTDLETKPAAVFRASFRVDERVGPEAVFGVIELDWHLRSGSFRPPSGPTSELKVHGWCGPWVLRTQDAEVALHTTSFWKQRFTIQHGGERYELRGRRWWRDGYDVLRDGCPIGTIEPRSWALHGVRLTATEAIPREVAVLMIWTGLRQWEDN